ncbi:MAG: copper-translocating P-type ATPase [Anaerolineales bacterium]|nr:copper-translocating P-type ATPase [Anaerolineales bacterium]
MLLYSEMLQHWLGFSAPGFSGDEWVAPIFSTIVFVYGGLPFLQMAVPELRQRRPGMMLLISLAISVSFLYSSAAFLFQLGEGFYWELVTLIDIMLLGHWLEMRSVRQASSSLDEIAKLMPDQAERMAADGSLQTVSAAVLQAGDLVLVRPGAGIPSDGEVVEGASTVNEALLTGESTPVSKAPGDRVIAGALNGDGSLRVRVTATGEGTALAGIMRLVRQAQQSRSRTQILADQAAGWLFYIALAAALLTGLAWTLAQGFDLVVLERVVTVLVIACPHALGLAIPLVVATSTSLAARHGLLIKDRLALEEARAINVVAFDKTGTLTLGQMRLAGMRTLQGWDEDTALALAAAVEGDSEHPLAAAVRDAAAERWLTLPAVSDFEAIKGQGVRALSEGQQVHLGGPRLLQLLGLRVPSEAAEFAQQAGLKAQTVMYLVVASQLAAVFSVADVVRPQSAEVIRRLHTLGVQVAMITGDSQAVADAVGAELGIDHIFAEVLPEHKEQKVAELQADGQRVAMVGDGVNDAPALARANVGIAIGSGTDVAVESAGIILVNSNPVDVIKIFELSRATYRKMIENLVWATGYNLVAIPLAAGALAWAGIVLSPAMGAVLMSISTVVVAINAQLLRRVRLGAI